MKTEHACNNSTLSSLETSSVAGSARRTTSAGVERIVLSGLVDDKTINSIVQETVSQLAKEGKRISLFPKRL